MGKRKIAALISLIVCLSLFWMPCAAYAVSTANANKPISLSEKCSLTMTYAHAGKSFSDISVSLYKIADVSSDYQYTLTKDFELTKLKLNGVSSADEMNTIRTTLEAYIAANNIKAYKTQNTDANGQVCFKELNPGMYMTASVQYSENGFRYAFDSVLITVPDLNEDGTWNYNVKATPKADVSTKPTPGGGNSQKKYLEYRVLKLWKDAGNGSERPESIEVDIVRNGEIVKTVLLSDKNNWSYSWRAEADGSSWVAAEKNVPDGYAMTLEKREASFTVINSAQDTQDTSDTSDTSDKQEISKDNGKTTETNIPKTGDTLNVGFYITLICVSGVVLVILSIVGKRKSK